MYTCSIIDLKIKWCELFTTKIKILHNIYSMHAYCLYNFAYVVYWRINGKGETKARVFSLNIAVLRFCSHHSAKMWRYFPFSRINKYAHNYTIIHHIYFAFLLAFLFHITHRTFNVYATVTLFHSWIFDSTQAERWRSNICTNANRCTNTPLFDSQHSIYIHTGSNYLLFFWLFLLLLLLLIFYSFSIRLNGSNKKKRKRVSP